MELIQENMGTVAVVVTALWAASEALSLIPAVKANGVFQLFYNVIKFVNGFLLKKK